MTNKIKVNIQTKTKIHFNGQEYASLDDLPAEARQAVAGALPQALASADGPQLHTTAKIIFNGQEYSSVNELPPDARQKYEQAMARIDQNHNGIPDMLEGGLLTTDRPESAFASAAPPPSTAPVIVPNPLDTPASSPPVKPSRFSMLLMLLVPILIALVLLLIILQFVQH